MPPASSTGMSRRSLLRSGSVLALGGLAALAPAPVSSAATASHGTTTTRTFTGRSPLGHDQWAYVPFEVGPGASRISVTAWYEEFELPGVTSQVLDLGLFDGRGWHPGTTGDTGGAPGFRGWSGGARREFTVTASDATPGYLAGPLTPGTWAVALGPIVLNPLGMAWEITVTVEHGGGGTPFAPEPAPVRVAGTGPGWYRGDLHVHSVHSDGTRQPAEVIAAARESTLDFFASTEHNTGSANRIWGRHAPSGLLVVNGEEVTTRHGHWLALGLPHDHWVDWRYGPLDHGVFARYANAVRDAGGLVAAAHPGVPPPGSAWEFGFAHVDAVEVWNSTWSPDDEAALGLWHTQLLAGRRLTALGNSDSHRPEQPLGLPQTVVGATALSVAAIVAALRRGRAYLAASAAVTLAVSAGSGGRTAGIGDELPVRRGHEVHLEARITGAPGATIVLHSALGPAAAARTGDDGTGTLTWRGWGAVRRFLRVEVRTDALTRMVALSNPVWLTR